MLGLTDDADNYDRGFLTDVSIMMASNPYLPEWSFSTRVAAALAIEPVFFNLRANGWLNESPVTSEWTNSRRTRT